MKTASSPKLKIACAKCNLSFKVDRGCVGDQPQKV
jgi:hypothetical protein